MENSEIPEVAAVISTGWGPSIDTSMRCRARTFKVQLREFPTNPKME